jgi:hypothetical protein
MSKSAAALNAQGVPDAVALLRGKRSSGAGNLSRREFFETVVVQVRSALPAELALFRHRAQSWLLKIDFGNERIHFEVWPDSLRGHVEIGLHFEDGPVSTTAYLAYFDTRIVEIKHLLGQHVELERWTVSWGHLFETAPLERLDHHFARTVGERLAAQITLLQPMVVEAAVSPERHDQRTAGGGRWSRRSKR